MSKIINIAFLVIKL